MLPEILSGSTQRRPGAEFCVDKPPSVDFEAVYGSLRNGSLRKGSLSGNRAARACLAPINRGKRPGAVREGTPQRGHR